MNKVLALRQVATSAESLPAMVGRAASALGNARSAAEILDARDMAGIAYDAAKRTARLAKAKKAHDDLIDAAHQAQADALEIEASAKSRLADEYDQAQERGEVVGPKGGGDSTVPVRNAATAADIGLTRKDIHEARLFRDAEKVEPGIIRRTLEETLDRGDEPSKAELRRVVTDAAMRGLRGKGRGKSGSRKNPIYEPPSPEFVAAMALTDGCTQLVDSLRDHSPKFILSGFIDEAELKRELPVIRKCRDLLTKFIEVANAQ